MTPARKSCIFFFFLGGGGGNVNQFHLMQKNTVVVVDIGTHRKLGLYKKILHAILCDVKVLNETHVLKNWVYQKNYYVERFLICSRLLTIKFFRLIKLFNHQRIRSLVVCCHEAGIASLFLFVSFVDL